MFPASPSRTWQTKQCSRPSPGHWFSTGMCGVYSVAQPQSTFWCVLLKVSPPPPAVRVGIIEFVAWEATGERQICHRARARIHVAPWVVAPTSLLRCRKFLTVRLKQDDEAPPLVFARAARRGHAGGPSVTANQSENHAQQLRHDHN